MTKTSPLISIGSSVFSLRNIGFALAVAAFVTVFAARLLAQSMDNVETNRNALPVTTDTIVIRDHYNRSRSFTGRASSKQQSRLGFELSGTLIKLLADDGSIFNTGDILASLDTSRLKAKLKQLNAQLAENEANLRLATNTHERVAKTNKQGHASQQMLDEAYSNLMAAKARKSATEASIQSLQIDITKSTITAPFDGLVTTRYIDTGTIVAAGTPVFSVIETSSIQAKIGVSPVIAKQLQSDTHFTLRNGQRETIEADFINVATAIRGQTRTMLATFDIQSPVSDGEIISLVINDPIYERGAWVPVRALAADVRGLWRIYKVVKIHGDHEVRFENVELVHSSGDMAFISGNIHDGDIFVPQGVSKLAKGQRVEIAMPSPSDR